MSQQDKIDAFLAQGPWAVAGASTNRDKYGNKVLRAYLQHGMSVTAVNPKERQVEGVPSYPSLSALPQVPAAVSVITPPSVTAKVLAEAADLGIGHVWLQPGAEDDAVLAEAARLGLEPIAGGPCVLVVLGYRE